MNFLPVEVMTPLLSLSSLCVVPVTLTLSNCSMAKMDVIIDLQHKSSRLVPSGEPAPPAPLHWLPLTQTFWRRHVCVFVSFPALRLQRCPVHSPGWVRASTSCSWSPRKSCVWRCEPVFSRRGSTTWTHPGCLPSPLGRPPCVRRTSRRPLQLSSSSTTPKGGSKRPDLTQTPPQRWSVGGVDDIISISRTSFFYKGVSQHMHLTRYHPALAPSVITVLFHTSRPQLSDPVCHLHGGSLKRRRQTCEHITPPRPAVMWQMPLWCCNRC